MALADDKPPEATEPTPQPQPTTQVVYVLQNPAMPGYVKIGKTDNLAQRVRSLFDTSVPVPFICFYAARVENSAKVETQLFEIFGDKRSHPKREFFAVEPHRVAAAIKLAEIEDVTPSATTDMSKEDITSLDDGIKRAGRYNFEMLDIPVGAELQFVKDHSILCTVVSQKPAKVDFRGVEMSVSRAAQEMLKYPSGVQGPLYWEYEGETLQERRARMESAESDDT